MESIPIGWKMGKFIFNIFFFKAKQTFINYVVKPIFSILITKKGLPIVKISFFFSKFYGKVVIIVSWLLFLNFQLKKKHSMY